MPANSLIWTPAKVGCYWDSGPYSICTSTLYVGGKPVRTYPESGYKLSCDREDLGIHKTLEAAQQFAEKHARMRRPGIAATTIGDNWSDLR